MITEHVHDALVQVRELRETLLGRLRFEGFSGSTRAISGTMALLTAAVMATPWFPAKTEAHLAGWASVLAVALCLNGGALAYWFWTDEVVDRDPRRLSPVLDALPPLFVGAIVTLALILHGLHEYLFGIWMCMFGLTNLASRNVVPRAICVVGLFYIACGALWLFSPRVSFLNPWPMGVVFFAGEWAGGIVLHLDHRRLDQLSASIGTQEKSYAEEE
ncbi:MAG: hypothetical protein KJ626_09785 [Verrucomicrobia bacterium]|nr:hypothetical protein [Verrucomicrobiota bacterium]